MNKKDLAQIKDLFDRSFKKNLNESFRKNFDEGFRVNFVKYFREIWDFNLEPSLNGILGRLDTLGARVDKLPTKQYIDDKIGDMRADMNKKFATYK
jgi:hypothetical protein